MQQKLAQASSVPSSSKSSTPPGSSKPRSPFSTSRRAFFKTASTALLGAGVRLPTPVGGIAEVLGLNVAGVRNATVFGRACARMITNGPELSDIDAGLSGNPGALFKLMSGSDSPLAPGEALLHAHRLAGAAVFPSHFNTVLQLRNSEDALLELRETEIPREVLQSFASELRARSSEFDDFTAIANDPEVAGSELRYAWDELRGMLGGLSDKASWIHTGIADYPPHLTPAVNLIRQSIVTPSSHAALASNVAFETNLRIIDLVHGAEQFALEGDVVLARVCAERARELRFKLGETFEPELSRELDKRLEGVEAKQIAPDEDTRTEQQEAFHKLQPPALPSLEQILSHRARENDVVLLYRKGHAPRIFYTRSNEIPFEEQLSIARIHDNVKLASLIKNCSNIAVFYVRRGFSEISSITLLPPDTRLPISEYDAASIRSRIPMTNSSAEQLSLYELR